jgi:UDP-N-acetylmuramate--alanine ligase
MLEGIRRVHFVGVGGIGVSAAAKWCLAKGKTVSGSDLRADAQTEALVRLGMRFFSGHAAGNVPNDVQLLVYSPAVPETNVERTRAAELGVPQQSYPEFLGALSKEYSTIVVSGTNGKSTTTALLGLMLEAAGYDPTVIVGSLVPSFEHGNLRMGGGRFFVVEGCEYRAHMLLLHPEMIVLTNVEEDHLDYYRDIDHIRETFQTFVGGLRGRGMVVTNADDAQSCRLEVDNRVTYGYKAGSYNVDSHPLRLQIPGRFNVMNALAATAAAMELGVPFETCRRVAESFPGIWRRFERVGTWRGAEVISDYGHHPTAVRGTVEAARELFPGRRVVLCFQPHQHSRTKEMIDGFAEAVATADAAVIPEIYAVAGRTEGEGVSSADLVEKARGIVGTTAPRGAHVVEYAKDLDDAESILRDMVRPGDVLVVQGAGDVDALARRLGI